jgi:hypothetical protein
VDEIDPGDELLDVVDEQDRVVGQATRREVRRRRLLHRFSSVLCRDGAGRLYVHRRTDDKDVYPGMYDMTAGGVLAAGGLPIGHHMICEALAGNRRSLDHPSRRRILVTSDVRKLASRSLQQSMTRRPGSVRKNVVSGETCSPPQESRRDRARRLPSCMAWTRATGMV